MQKLEEPELQVEIARREWGFSDGQMVREFTFADFVQAMAFVNQAAALAEAQGHHPDIDIRYNRVKMGLVTHDAGGVTAKDLEMATDLNGIAAGMGGGTK